MPSVTLAETGMAARRTAAARFGDAGNLGELLAAVTLAAGYLAARRTAKLDPPAALRHD